MHETVKRREENGSKKWVKKIGQKSVKEDNNSSPSNSYKKIKKKGQKNGA